MESLATKRHRELREAKDQKAEADAVRRKAQLRIEELIPVGSVLWIGDDRMVDGGYAGLVQSHTGWWVGLGHMRVRNTATGKTRNAYLSDVDHIISRPTKGSS